MRGAGPVTLTPTELELEKEPLKRTPVARCVRSWVRYGAVPLLVDAEAVADRACGRSQMAGAGGGTLGVGFCCSTKIANWRALSAAAHSVGF